MLTVKEWRRARGFSMQKMADLLGIHVNTYISWEDNPGKISIENAFKIADLFSVEISDINFLCAETLQKCGEE